MNNSQIHSLPSNVATVQALARAGHLQEATSAAAQSAELTLSAVREAHQASCADGGAMELLLREALGDAVRLYQRLDLISSFSAALLARIPHQ